MILIVKIVKKNKNKKTLKIWKNAMIQIVKKEIKDKKTLKIWKNVMIQIVKIIVVQYNDE